MQFPSIISFHQHDILQRGRAEVVLTDLLFTVKAYGDPRGRVSLHKAGSLISGEAWDPPPTASSRRAPYSCGSQRAMHFSHGRGVDARHPPQNYWIGSGGGAISAAAAKDDLVFPLQSSVLRHEDK